MADKAPPWDNETIRRINLRNQTFWREESEIAMRRAVMPDTLENAMERIQSEEQRFVPIRYRLTMEDALMGASRAEARSGPRLAQEARSSLARQGGHAEKPDALQKIIEVIVARNPSIDTSGLLRKLDSISGDDATVVTVNDEVIEFEPTSGAKLKTAPVSGLKDRLYRAKRKRSNAEIGRRHQPPT
jgi:hypothetical protein